MGLRRWFSMAVSAPRVARAALCFQACSALDLLDLLFCPLGALSPLMAKPCPLQILTRHPFTIRSLATRSRWRASAWSRATRRSGPCVPLSMSTTISPEPPARASIQMGLPPAVWRRRGGFAAVQGLTGSAAGDIRPARKYPSRCKLRHTLGFIPIVRQGLIDVCAASAQADEWRDGHGAAIHTEQDRTLHGMRGAMGGRSCATARVGRAPVRWP